MTTAASQANKGNGILPLNLHFDPRMRFLDSSLMRRYRDLYNIDLIHHVAGIMANKVISGGLRIQRAGFTPSTNTQHAYEHAWTEFVRRLLDSMWCFGFAASVSMPDENIGTVPLVLDVELLRVGITSDYMGRRVYTFFEENFLYGQSSTAYRPIPDVTVYEYTPPLPDGSLNSCISRILPYYNQMLIATEADLRVVLSNSAPSLWTQRQSADRAGKPNLTSLHTPPSSNDEGARAAGVAPQTSSGGIAPRQPDPIMPVRIVAHRDLNADSLPSRMLARMPQLDEGTRVMKLPDGQEGHAFAALPEPAYLPHIVEKFEQSIASAFNVPVTLFSADKLIRRDRTSHAQRLEAAVMAFEQNVRALQLRILDIVNDASEKMYGPRFREDAFIMAIEDPTYAEIATRTQQVSWFIDVLVEPVVIEKLFYEGTLKRQAYLAFLTRHYGIDPASFEPTPGLTLLELNGIDPPDTDTNTPAPKKAIKSRTAAATTAAAAAAKKRKK